MDLGGEFSGEDGFREIREVEREPGEGSVTEAKGRGLHESVKSYRRTRKTREWFQLL